MWFLRAVSTTSFLTAKASIATQTFKDPILSVLNVLDLSMPMRVISGSVSHNLAKGLSNALDIEFVQSKKDVFPDGEFRVILPESNQDSLIVQSCPHPQEKNLLEILFMLDGCKSDKKIAIIPYLPYSRQDKEFLGGDVISAKTIAKLIESCGATHIITADSHSQIALSYFKIPVTNVSAMPEFGKYFVESGLNDPIIIAPDKKALMFAKLIEKETGGQSIYFEKTRNRNTGEVSFQFPEINVQNRDVIICDDIVSSGSTIIPAIKFAKTGGSKTIRIAVTHGLFLDGVVEKLKSLGADEIVISDSINRSDVKTISLSSQIAKSIKG